MFAKFDEIPSMILQNIKETKRYGHTVGRTDNVKTVYPPTNTVCGGIKIHVYVVKYSMCKQNQRTNGPVNAHLISWPSKAQNIQNLENIW